MRIKVNLSIICAIFFYMFTFSAFAQTVTKGIYLTQSTLENTHHLQYLIRQAQASGINTFVIDFNYMSKKYRQNIPLVLNSHIKYVARIVMYPGGGTHQQIVSQAYWQKKYNLAQQAIALGASEIQLDYIRYNTSGAASSAKSKDVYAVLTWFKEKLAAQNIPLEIDVFGITSYGEEKHIGQNVHLFANTVDALCPMNYPSHFEPFRQHAVTPYQTVYQALTAMQEQVRGQPPVKIYSYLELSNYRYPLSHQQKMKYISAQIKAINDAGADGWYAWSPSNRYDNLFRVLQNNPTSAPQVYVSN